jgi:hypothetical protein
MWQPGRVHSLVFGLAFLLVSIEIQYVQITLWMTAPRRGRPIAKDETDTRFRRVQCAPLHHRNRVTVDNTTDM